MSAEKSIVWPQVFAVNTRLALRISLPLSVVLLLATPSVFSISYLDAQSSATVLERFVSLIGILLFTPLFLPEQGEGTDLRGLMRSKEFPLGGVYGLRIAAAEIASLLLISLFGMAMWLFGCEFPVEYLFGALANAVLLGGLGCLACALSENAVVGYLIPLAWYGCNLFNAPERLGPLALFTLYPTGDPGGKLPLLLAGLLLLVVSAAFAQRRRP